MVKGRRDGGIEGLRDFVNLSLHHFVLTLTIKLFYISLIATSEK